MLKKAALALFISLAHLALTVYAYGQAEVYPPDATAQMWAHATRIIAFPVMYLLLLEKHIAVSAYLGFDWFPVLMVLNSLFWGSIVVLLGNAVTKLKTPAKLS